jgi:mutator protein MutT
MRPTEGSRAAPPCGVCGSTPDRCPGPRCGDVERDERTVPVVAAVVRRGGALLLCRRPDHKRHGGLWEFPGGKSAPGETLAEAAARELREELGLELAGVGARLGSHRDPGSSFVVHFVEVEAAGDPRAAEHDEVAWVADDDIAGLALAPADRAFVEARAASRRPTGTN